MKQKNRKRAVIAIMLLISMMVTPLITAADNPTITINPEHPKPKGTVTFTASIPTDETVTKVVIYVEECESGLCFTDNFNETMTKTGSNTYEKTITLRHKTAVEMKYRIGYETSSGWTWYPADTSNLISVNLDTSNNGGNGDNGESDTPSFEVITFIAAISFILLIFFKRRR